MEKGLRMTPIPVTTQMRVMVDGLPTMEWIDIEGSPLSEADFDKMLTLDGMQVRQLYDDNGEWLFEGGDGKPDFSLSLSGMSMKEGGLFPDDVRIMRQDVDGTTLAGPYYLKTSADVVAGALFDFCARLTTMDKALTVGADHLSPPILEVLKEWAEERGLDLDEARVEDWATELK